MKHTLICTFVCFGYWNFRENIRFVIPLSTLRPLWSMWLKIEIIRYFVNWGRLKWTLFVSFKMFNASIDTWILFKKQKYMDISSHPNDPDYDSIFISITFHVRRFSVFQYSTLKWARRMSPKHTKPPIVSNNRSGIHGAVVAPLVVLLHVKSKCCQDFYCVHFSCSYVLHLLEPKKIFHIPPNHLFSLNIVYLYFLILPLHISSVVCHEDIELHRIRWCI